MEADPELMESRLEQQRVRGKVHRELMKAKKIVAGHLEKIQEETQEPELL